MSRVTSSPASAPSGIGHRHAQAVIMFFGFALAYALRVNLTVSIVEMIKDQPDNQTITSHHSQLKVLNITGTQRGLILSSFFMGYAIPQIPAGPFVRKYGSSLPLAAAIASSGILTLLTPLATFKGGWIGLTITRICLGLAQGVLYPCVNQLITKWSAPQERSQLFAFTFGGAPFGSICMMLAGGLMASGPLGWPLVFYVSGSLAVLWGIICAVFGASSPSQHRYISEDERFYIVSNQISLSQDDGEMETPWKEIWTSVPMWALNITYLTNIWGYWTLLSLLPTYINGVFKFNIEKNGALSALPYICMWITSIIFSRVADCIVNNNILSLAVARKMWNTLSQFGPAICLILLAFIKSNVVTAIALLTVSATLNAAMYVGYLMNPSDLSPNFTGTLMGIANGLSNISAILGPLISSSIVSNTSDVHQWRIVFLLTAALFVAGSVIFLIFGSTRVQPWNNPRRTSVEGSRL